jgi:hypothetical protein
MVAVIVAALIAAGYLIGGFGLWWYRKEFYPLEKFGYLIFPYITVWVTFYVGTLLVPPDPSSFGFYQWLSRFGHFWAIAIMIVVSMFGAWQRRRDNGAT